MKITTIYYKVYQISVSKNKTIFKWISQIHYEIYCQSPLLPWIQVKIIFG